MVLEGFQVLQSLWSRFEGPARLVVGKKVVVDQRFQILVEHVQVETRSIHQPRLSLWGGCADYQSGNLVVVSPRSSLTHRNALHRSTPRKALAFRVRLPFLPLLIILRFGSKGKTKRSTILSAWLFHTYRTGLLQPRVTSRSGSPRNRMRGSDELPYIWAEFGSAHSQRGRRESLLQRLRLSWAGRGGNRADAGFVFPVFLPPKHMSIE